MIRSYQGKKVSKGDSIPVNDALVVESPFAIYINGDPLTVTMQTPGHELFLGIGLLISEGIIPRKQANVPFHFDEHATDPTIHFEISNPASIANKRSLLSVSSCGICGKTSFETPLGEALNPLNKEWELDKMFDEMRKLQTDFDKSGGLHAAALFDQDQNLINCFEDIGRHNAVDKCIGHYYLNHSENAPAIILVSGRISYEIIAKCFMAKIPAIAAVSAPSSLAVDYAKEWGIQLFGFCRENRYTQYA
jgi:FdhD protein